MQEQHVASVLDSDLNEQDGANLLSEPSDEGEDEEVHRLRPAQPNVPASLAKQPGSHTETLQV